RLWHRLARPRRAARRASVVAAVSRATAEEVRRRWAIPADRVAVVHNGVDLPPAGAGDAPAGLPARYLLFVGALEPRKAPELLVEAFRLARSRGLDAELVIAGEGRLAPRLRAPGVHLLGRVPRDSPPDLHARALALALPSWLEA